MVYYYNTFLSLIFLSLVHVCGLVEAWAYVASSRRLRKHKLRCNLNMFSKLILNVFLLAVEPEFKYVGNMHGNEVVSREVLLKLAVDLCDRYLAGDKMVHKLLSTTRVHIMPTMNPDGWEIANAEVG